MLLTLGALISPGYGAPAAELFDRSDALFQASESHTATVIGTEGARKGYTLKVDTVRFGAYSLEVTQQLDPETGWPPQEKRIWGDGYVRIGGLSGSWMYWFSLSAAVRLEGETKDLPDPPYCGLLMYCGLREVNNRRVVAEAIWQDTAGGHLRARYVAWRGVTDRFGYVLQYFPPPERQLTSLTYKLFCTPLWYNTDRVRKRWLITPLRSEEVPLEPSPIDLAQEWAMVFCTRYGLQTAGGTLALDSDSIEAATVSQSTAGTIGALLTPRDPLGEVRVVMGDWAGETYPIAAERYLGSLPAVKQDLARTAEVKVALPVPPTEAEEQDVARLLALYPTLGEKFGAELQSAHQELDESLAAAQEDSPAHFLRWYEANERWKKAVGDMRAAWIKEKLWLQEG